MLKRMKMTPPLMSTAAACLLAASWSAAVAEPVSYSTASRAFAAEMVGKHGFSESELGALMAEARYTQAIIDAMNRPYEAKPWRDYRKLFLTPERIDGGVAFLGEHRALLRKAEAAYGVPAEVIVAIIGIETNYGRNLGSHRVIDALSTLGFSYPRRAAFFRKELEEFLLLTRDEEVDARSAVGSYAGAVGKPQFIPSSYRAYAIDFDGDGRRDLWNSDADVVGSVAHYLSRHGWLRNQPVALEARLTAGKPANVNIAEKRPLAPEVGLAQLAAAGVEPAADSDAPAPGADAKAVLIELDGDGPEYWLGFGNFYAITRYNHSNLYAMAVHQLSREVARRYRETEG